MGLRDSYHYQLCSLLCVPSTFFLYNCNMFWMMLAFIIYAIMMFFPKFLRFLYDPGVFVSCSTFYHYYAWSLMCLLNMLFTIRVSSLAPAHWLLHHYSAHSSFSFLLEDVLYYSCFEDFTKSEYWKFTFTCNTYNWHQHLTPVNYFYNSSKFQHL